MLDDRHNASRMKRNGAGFSLIELLIVVAIILIVAAIAIPNMLRAKMAANEASAVSNIRTISSASMIYSSTYGNGYPGSLDIMGGLGAANCNAAILLDETLTVPPYTKSGYQFNFLPQGPPIASIPPGCAAAGFSAYLTTAVPRVFGTTGITSFCSDEPGTIYFDVTGAAATTPAQCESLPPLH